MKQHSAKIAVGVIVLSFLVTLIGARNFRVGEIPNGSVNNCANCHINPAGGGARNAFGQEVEANFLTAPGFSGHVIWGWDLAKLDSDGDGFTNGQELQDPFGLWQQGDPAPGNPAYVSNPGDASSTPPAFVGIPSLHVSFSGMNPHVNEMLELRVVDKATRLEVGRTTVASIPAPDFDVVLLNILQIGGSYWVDFYADHNGNGLYDPPPTDHAWRLNLDNVQGDTTLTFTHNTNFTDIQWNYLLTVDLMGMNPHLNQMFALRVVDKGSNQEVGRVKLDSIPSPDFSVSVAGLQVGHSYSVDFFADHNGNGLYDPPPTDHAWRLDADNVGGNTTLNFTHNTNFTDIGWNYLLVFNLMNMNPHVGQQLEVRVRDKYNLHEIGRVTLSEIPLPDITVFVPGLEIGHDYLVDFYADHNGNGLFDPPPTDHAWRLNLDGVSGDATLDFTHNVNFANIDWDYVLTMNLMGMNPHVGQQFELRVWNQATGAEAGRVKLSAIPLPDFTVMIGGLQVGESYWVDFWADHNGNGLYDLPPADHSWQMELVNVQGYETLEFTHNTNFTPLQWEYLFTLNLFNMNPHVGQLFELRVVDEASGREVGRVSLDSILVPNFSVSTSGLEVGHNYRADFYADHNGNGHYDPPPTDHAWRITFTDLAGDTTLEFMHNTNFTNIDWPTSIDLDQQTGVPAFFALMNNYPNPFNPSTTIPFQVPQNSRLKIEIYNVLGQKVRTLLDKNLTAGKYEVRWDGLNDFGQALGSGIYLYRMTADNFTQTQQMILLK